MSINIQTEKINRPTVSTRITSKLAASHKKIVSRVVLVTPPSVHLFGDDLVHNNSIILK